MIVYNTTQDPVVIVVKWSPDLLGGPATIESTVMVMPNDGIDLNAYGLKTKEEMEKK